MVSFIKINNDWKGNGVCYLKNNGEWTVINQSQFSAIVSTNVVFFGGYIHTDVDHTSLSIVGPSTIEGASSQLAAICDGTIDITSSASWSITNGSSYASISSNGTLTISSNANNSTVTVQAVYAGLTATTNVSVTYKNGVTAQTETTVETDGQGNTTVTTTTESSDGSSSSISTHYDSNGNETGHEQETTDTSGNTSTQTVQKDNNGNDVVTGYDIDTSNNTSGGLSVSNGIDTGVLVFDGHDWTATLKAKLLFSDFTANVQYPIMNVSSRGDDNKLDGAFFLVTKKTSGQGSGVYDENGTQQSTTTSNNPTLIWRIQNYLGGSLQNGIDFYYKNGTRAYYTNKFGSKTTALTLTYKMVYTESNHQLVTEIYAANGTTILAKPRSEAVVTFTRTMTDITFEIGKATNVSGTELLTKLEVLDFHVEKTI